MVTKKDMLRKLKVTQLRDLAKSFELEAGGKKEDVITELSNKMKKEDVFDQLNRLTLTKPDFALFEHEMVPVHEVMPEADLSVILAKYNCDKNAFPKIKYTDSAIKFLGARPGDVVRIKRKSITAGIADYYRLVTK